MDNTKLQMDDVQIHEMTKRRHNLVTSLFIFLKFTTNAQEEFEQVTAKIIDTFCSTYNRACVPIRIGEDSR